MHKLQIMGTHGHRELQWDPKKVMTEDEETKAVLAEAEQILEEALAKGHAVFRIEAPDQPAVRTKVLDPTAPRTVIVPRMAGG